ncbi:hypothetical protein PUV54_12630 [Hyphococcus flavus]|uniref:Uncharacterized protein n=1 Tax=Hyphococcus flavus TaxID=1866326 RepID=A0AAE9ZAQ0_9PROT|nr:hypothetical protein [Hyphococcus flavus]WDI30799.1 hypothetical protein PUV54_12630 [Hyphococcus flavus]
MSGAAQKLETGDRIGNVGFNRRVTIFLIFLVFGPPIGGLIAIHGFLLYMILQTGLSEVFPEFKFQTLLGLVLWPIWAFMLSLYGYIFGGIQAGVTGCILAIIADRNGRFSYQIAVMATLPSSLLAAIHFGLRGNGELFFAAILAGVSVAASLIVRFLFRKRFQPVRGV